MDEENGAIEGAKVNENKIQIVMGVISAILILVLIIFIIIHKNNSGEGEDE